MLMALASMSRPLGLPPGSGGASQGATHSMGGSTSPLAEMGGGFSRGNQFQPQNIAQMGSGLPDWMTNANLPVGMNQGSMAGLTLAQNAGRIGQGLGALLGIPGLGYLGNYLGGQYMNNNVFQSPAPPSDFQQAINDYVGDSFMQDARQNSSQMNPQYQQYSDPRRNNMSAFNFIWGRGK